MLSSLHQIEGKSNEVYSQINDIYVFSYFYKWM